jgi:hypothetical protein
MVMNATTPAEMEYRVVPAGLFKATCLRLLDEVYEDRNLTIIVTKRGKPLGKLVAAPLGIKLSDPTVELPINTPVIYASKSWTQDDVNAIEEHRKNKKKRKDKKKGKHK